MQLHSVNIRYVRVFIKQGRRRQDSSSSLFPKIQALQNLRHFLWTMLSIPEIVAFALLYHQKPESLLCSCLQGVSSVVTWYQTFLRFLIFLNIEYLLFFTCHFLVVLGQSVLADHVPFHII